MEPDWIILTSSASTSAGELRPTLRARSERERVMKVLVSLLMLDRVWLDTTCFTRPVLLS